MYVSNVTSTTNVQDSTSKEQNTQNSTIQFSLSEYKDKEPTEITFKEYQNLTPEDIEKLYPKDQMSNQYEKAISLQTKANGTHDEILNEVLFDKEIASDGSEFDKRVSHMIDFRMIHQEMLVRLELAIDQVDQYIKDNNITFDTDNPEKSRAKYLQVLSKVEQELVVPEERKTISKEELFSMFEHNKVGAEANIEYHKYTPEDEQYQYYQAMIAYEKSIVAEYKKRVSEQESSLASHQSNQSAAHAISQAQEAKDKDQTKKTESSSSINEMIQTKESRKEYYERMRKIIEDIRSVMLTGLTVEELEQLKELLSKLESLKKKDDPKDKEEIEALVKQLEEMVLAYQKRISGVAINDAEDEEKKEPSKVEVHTLDERLDALSKAIEDIQSGRYKDESKKEDDEDENDLGSQDSFISELMKQGYSQSEAKQRADIYKDAGLFSSFGGMGNVFDTELFGIGLSANPTYKKALLNAFEQMDTNQLQNLSSELNTRYNIDMEELKKRIPENLQVSDALLHGFDDYLGYQFASPDKVFGMLDKMMDQATMMERLTGEDQSEVIDGIDKVMSSYTQNLILSRRGTLL